jgi:integrase
VTVLTAIACCDPLLNRQLEHPVVAAVGQVDVASGVNRHPKRIGQPGLRRGEISGLEWSDVKLDDDCDGGTLTIAHNRVSVGGKVHDASR